MPCAIRTGTSQNSTDAKRTFGPMTDFHPEADEADLDLLHALKEPTEYEAHIPGPFLRMGAVHHCANWRGASAPAQLLNSCTTSAPAQIWARR